MFVWWGVSMSSVLSSASGENMPDRDTRMSAEQQHTAESQLHSMEIVLAIPTI